MAINSPDRKLEIGDIIYKVVYDPFINNKPEWFIIPYKIKDIYYTDACYAELEFIKDNNATANKIILSKDSLEDYFYSYEKAEAQVEYLRSRPISYAWGYNTHGEQEGTIGYSSHDEEDEDDFELEVIYFDDEDEVKETIVDKIKQFFIDLYNRATKFMLDKWEDFLS